MELSVPGLRLTVAITLSEVEILVEALGTLDAEYGLTDEGRALLERMTEARTRLRAEQ